MTDSNSYVQSTIEHLKTISLIYYTIYACCPIVFLNTQLKYKTKNLDSQFLYHITKQYV